MPRDSQRSKVYRWEDSLRWYTLVDQFAEEHDRVIDVRVGKDGRGVALHHPTAQRIKRPRLLKPDEAAKPAVLEWTNWLSIEDWMDHEGLHSAWVAFFHAHPYNHHFKDVDQARQFIMYLWQKYSRVFGCKNAPPRVRFSDSGNHASYNYYFNLIHLPPFGQNKRIVIHEMTHYFNDHDKRKDYGKWVPHGPQFVGKMIYMLERECLLDADWARSLARDRRVRYEVVGE